MNVGCIMVTENRAPICGIALSSFLNQTYKKSVLCVVCPQKVKYQQVIERLLIPRARFSVNGSIYVDNKSIVKDEYYLENDKVIIFVWSDMTGAESVPRRIDLACKILFDQYNCQVVTMWDDDDWSASNRINDIVSVYRINKQNHDSFIIGVSSGCFVNLRTFRAETISSQPLWGASIAFDKDTWASCGYFFNGSVPGYDREFMSKCKNFLEIGYMHLAFSHGDNVATWLKSPGVQFEGQMRQAMSKEEFDEVKKASKFLVDKRIFPPQP